MSQLQRNIIILTISLIAFGICGGQAQELPPGLRNFLIEFGKTSSLGVYDDAMMVNKVSERTIDKYTNLFSSPEVVVFNDVYHAKDAPVYITVQEYCDLLAEHYPEGFRSFVYSPRLIRFFRSGKRTFYEVEVEKYLAIDFALENPPKIYFDPYVKLKLTIVEIDGSYKIIMIEQAESALIPSLWSNSLIPQGVHLFGGTGNYNLNMHDIPQSLTGYRSTNGTDNTAGVNFYWDINGKSNFKYGVLTGIEYHQLKGAIQVDDYQYSFRDVDKDNYTYIKLVTANNLKQSFSYDVWSVPIGFHLDYAFDSRWRPVVNSANVARERDPLKRGLRVSFDAGLQYNYVTSTEVTSNSGTFAFKGDYTIWNPNTNDSSHVIISDLPEYGFYSDTAFSDSKIESRTKDSYFSVFARLNFAYPISKKFELFAAPTFNFAVQGINNTDDDFVLSRTAGQTENLMSASKIATSGVGFRAGVIMNLKPPKNEYYHYPELNQFKPVAADKPPRYKGVTNKYKLTLSPQSGIKERIQVELDGEWLTKSKSWRFSSRKDKRITLKYPIEKSMLATGQLVIHKPFGIEVRTMNCSYYNDINKGNLTIPLDSIVEGSACVDDQHLDLSVEKLAPFNFVYVTLNGRDNAEIRRDLVGELRKLYRNARFEDEEILIYISTETSRPVVFVNFEVLNQDHLDFKIFNETQFDEFITGVQTKYNSTIEDYNEDIYNIEVVMGENFKIEQRLNASRRYVDFYFLPLDVTFYRVPGYIEEADNTILQELILALTNKYCLGVPSGEDQYQVNVLLRADQYKEISLDQRIPINECNNNIILY